MTKTAVAYAIPVRCTVLKYYTKQSLRAGSLKDKDSWMGVWSGKQWQPGMMSDERNKVRERPEAVDCTSKAKARQKTQLKRK